MHMVGFSPQARNNEPLLWPSVTQEAPSDAQILLVDGQISVFASIATPPSWKGRN